MLKLQINVDEIARQLKDFQLEVSQDLQKGISNLAAMTHAKVLELASGELNSTRQNFTDSLGFEEIAPGVWVVSVDEKGLFIEEGIEASKDMKPDLLKNATKTSKDGHKYRAIPFNYGKSPSQLTLKTQGFVNQIKQELRRANIPFKKIEKTSEGSPRIGKLHTLNIKSEKPSTKATTEALQGLTIYQSLGQNGKVRRDIMTFRSVTSGPAGEGKFIHPGLTAKHFLDRSMAWAEKTWETDILPEILSKYK